MSQAAVALRLLGPRVPLMLKTAAFQTLGLSDESSKWDLKTALVVNTLRSIMSESTSSISKQQNFSLRDPGVKGNMWISTVTLPAPEDDIRQLLFRTIEEMSETKDETYTKPTLEPVEAEWTGYRKDATSETPVPQGLSEADKYNKMMEEVESDVTILYFHGGAYYLMDPASHRPVVSKLAKVTKGRALSVRYRLAPQHPFPAALLDCIVAYLSLLYPPEGSFHKPVKPEHIIFAGDSAGGNMTLAVLLFVLHLHQSGQAKVLWHGREVEVPIPGGAAPNSAWADMLHALPSWEKNAHFDYLPARRDSDIAPTKNPPNPPACKAWPSDPPRADLYCDGSLLMHPLASPLAAKPDAWKGAPPMFFCYGEEMLSDEGKVVAQRIARHGTPVRFEAFEAMPHVFAAMFVGSPGSERCFEGWGGWMTKVVEGGKDAAPKGAVWIEAKTMKETELDVEKLIDFSDEQVTEMLKEEKVKRSRVFEERFGAGKGPEAARL